MEWYDYILMFMTMALLLTPLVIAKLRKKDVSGCGGSCSSCNKNCGIKDFLQARKEGKL